MSTVQDFWRMLWQYKAPVVVMLTEEVEKGRVSDDVYVQGWVQLESVCCGVCRNVVRDTGLRLSSSLWSMEVCMWSSMWRETLARIRTETWQ